MVKLRAALTNGPGSQSIKHKVLQRGRRTKYFLKDNYRISDGSNSMHSVTTHCTSVKRTAKQHSKSPKNTLTRDRAPQDIAKTG